MATGATTQSTQVPTQIADVASQHHFVDDSDIWGVLLPCNPNNPNVCRVSFYKSQPRYTFGRSPQNDIRFPKCMIVSNNHCIIEWDGDESAQSAVKVTDLSTNGTFINGERIAVNSEEKCKILHDGNEIAFGAWVPQPADRVHEDYRFIFRLKAGGAPTIGLDRFYDLQHILGRGSFATVYKALHKAEGDWYAVKVIQASKLRKDMVGASAAGVQPDNIPSTFKREIDILKRLHHQNICQFKEVFFETNNISLVLEWVRGGDLLDYLEKHNALSEPETQYITYQICDALAYVHSLGIAHRDLKPENILLTDDKPPIVKIADFGLAKVVDTLTVLHTMCGTPAYLAPEVVTKGSGGYDQVVDSWSVGVIVFSMLTMCTPFREDPSHTDVTSQVANRKVEWPILQMRGVSTLGEEFIRRLMQYDPQKRMTLTEARDHPWLAEQAVQRRTDVSQPTVSQDVSVDTSSQPHAAAPDVSMRSTVSDHVAHDSAGAVVATEPSPSGSRAATPPHVSEEDNLASSQLDDPTPSQVGSQTSRVQRRAEVIRRAHNKGVELPGPSQEMQARAIAEDSRDPDTKDGDNELPHVEPQRGSKRKASELGPESPPSAVNGEKGAAAEASLSEDGVRAGSSHTGSKNGRVGPKRATGPPSFKRSHKQAPSTPAAENDEDEVPGLTMGRRRSSRLKSPAKPSSVRKS